MPNIPLKFFQYLKQLIHLECYTYGILEKQIILITTEGDSFYAIFCLRDQITSKYAPFSG